jgi:hypothetical protein
MEINFPEESAAHPIWPKVFEYHLDGKNFMVNTATKMSEQAARNTRSNTPFIGPERPEDLRSQYFDGTGWDEE